MHLAKSWCNEIITSTFVMSRDHLIHKTRCNGFNASLFSKNRCNGFNASLFRKKSWNETVVPHYTDFSFFCSFLFLTVMFLLQEWLVSKENTHSCLEVYCWYCTHPSWCIASNAVLGLRPRTALNGMHYSGSVHYQQYTSRHSCVFSLLARHSCSNISFHAHAWWSAEFGFWPFFVQVTYK